MKVLAIDTSARDLSLALGDGERVLVARNISFKKDLSQKIAGYIERIVGKKMQGLDTVVIGLGPGSFTGLRVGMAAAKALCFSLDIPIIGISSLDALAQAQAGEGKNVCALIDARRGLFYACFYESKNGVLRRKTAYLLAPIEKILEEISGEVIFVGDGTALAEKDIKENEGRGYRIAVRRGRTLFAPALRPQARDLLALGCARIRKKDFDDSKTLTPIYLYPADCQVRRGGLTPP